MLLPMPLPCIAVPFSIAVPFPTVLDGLKDRKARRIVVSGSDKAGNTCVLASVEKQRVGPRDPAASVAGLPS